MQGDPTGGGTGSYEGENLCIARDGDSSRQMPDAGAAEGISLATASADTPDIVVAAGSRPGNGSADAWAHRGNTASDSRTYTGNNVAESKLRAQNSNTGTRARPGNVTLRQQTRYSHSSSDSSGALKLSRPRNLAVGMSSCRL